MLVVPETSTPVWVLILLFGTPIVTTTLLTTLAALLTTLVLTILATSTPLLAALILILILRHYITSLVWDNSHHNPTVQVFNTFLLLLDRGNDLKIVRIERDLTPN